MKRKQHKTTPETYIFGTGAHNGKMLLATNIKKKYIQGIKSDIIS